MADHADDTLAPGVITKVEQQRRLRQRYNLFIDEKFAFFVHEDMLVKHRLLKGEVVDASRLQQILYEEEINKAYLDAIRLLSSRLRSEHEVLKRLQQKGYSPEIGQVTIERLRKEGYLNDSLFAEQLTKQRLESQKKGSRWIKQELQQKGINKEQITEAMEQVDEETEYQMAYTLTIKRYGAALEKDALKARRKIVGFLQRRGYPGSVVSKVLGRLPVQGQEDEWNVSDLDED